MACRKKIVAKNKKQWLKTYCLEFIKFWFALALLHLMALKSSNLLQLSILAHVLRKQKENKKSLQSMNDSITNQSPNILIFYKKMF